jgi:hypothetical protein
MLNEPNNKIVGAFVLGLALVGGAYLAGNFGQPTNTGQPATAVTAIEAPVRTAIAVSDNDNNGIEDWRDAFVTTEAVVIPEKNEPYEAPTTLTGRTGVSFMESLLHGRIQGPFGNSSEEVIADTVDLLAQETTAILYDTKDVVVLERWTDEDIKNYGNAMGGSISTLDIEAKENELLILDDIINRNQPERMKELVLYANGYKTLKEKALVTPVPAIFLKGHLDLINTYEALRTDISAMTMIESDPAVALLRIKRYENDVQGLSLALQNMYKILEPYSKFFAANDAAVIFGSFNNINQP